MWSSHAVSALKQSIGRGGNISARYYSTPSPVEAAVIGAGLAGSLLTVYLRRRGYDVHLYEKFGDIRSDDGNEGRSINLVLTSRGIRALEAVGLKDRVESITVPVFGRALHAMDGSVAVQKYGPDDSYYNLSVSRLELNRVLLNAAEEAGASIHFNADIRDIDLANERAPGFEVATNGGGRYRKVYADHIFGVDGAASATRRAVVGAAGERGQDMTMPLGVSYKELSLLSRDDGSPALQRDMLHIWPRGEHFLMALSNLDNTFTMTLYLPDEGEISFASLREGGKDSIKRYFETFYADALEFMPNYMKEYDENPVGFLGTLQASPWHVGDRAVLLGDACHAITPFFGQGCNSSFEDVRVLDDLMRSKAGGCGKVPKNMMSDVFAEYDAERKRNGDAIARLAIDNYKEMSDRTADPRFLLMKDIELRLSKAHPALYSSRYAMVTHTHVPYEVCERVGEAQQEVLEILATPGMSDASDVDMELASSLIRERIGPILERSGVTESDLAG
eukprot:g1928.t1